MIVRFSKYHGLGNDFILIDENDVLNVNIQELAQNLCNRHTGIGADGLIIVKHDPLEMIYYNSDGSRAKMCGNGIRCFANYCIDNNIVTKPNFTVKTLAGYYNITVLSTQPFTVSVDMGYPEFNPMMIPVLSSKPEFINQEIRVLDKTFVVSSIFMGTIHTTVEVNSLDDIDLRLYGKALHELPLFPEKTNVNFYEILNDNTIKIQTYERGAGLTLACGTGATAVYAVLKHTATNQTPITFQLPLGTMTLHSSTIGAIIMTGPATFVYAGEIGVI